MQRLCESPYLFKEARRKGFEPLIPRFEVWCSASPSDHFSLDCWQSEQQDYPERTGISVRSERYYAGFGSAFGTPGSRPAGSSSRAKTRRFYAKIWRPPCVVQESESPHPALGGVWG
jgi:hypothetical protein